MTDPKRRDPDGELLPEELLWADGGHASDIVLTALGDAQKDIIPLAVRAHVERCTACMAHLGHASLLSLHTESALEVRAEHERAAAPARRPLPLVAIALGLAVALLGLVPGILERQASGASLVDRLAHDVLLFVRGLGTIAHRIDEHGGLFVSYGAAALLVCMGIAISRLLPKKEASR